MKSRYPVTIPAPLLGVAVVVVAASSLISVISSTGSKNVAEERAAAAEVRAAAISDVVTCRDRLDVDVTKANTAYSFATGELAGATSRLLVLLAVGGDASSALAKIDASTDAQLQAHDRLDTATKARAAFEAHPSGTCLPPRPTTTPTSLPPGTLPEPTTATTTRRHATTTTTRPTTTVPTTTTTTYRPPPTTVPRGRLCDLLPLTIPGVSTCP